MKIKKLFAAVLTTIMFCLVMPITASATADEAAAIAEITAGLNAEFLDFSVTYTDNTPSSYYMAIEQKVNGWLDSNRSDYCTPNAIAPTVTIPDDLANGTALNPTGSGPKTGSFDVTIATNDYEYVVLFEYSHAITFVPTVYTPTDAEVVAAAKAALTWDIIKNANTDQNAVTGDLTLPTTGDNGTTISWFSYQSAISTPAGTVTRPVSPALDELVALTATITKGEASDTITINFTVSARQPSSDATLSALSINGSPIAGFNSAVTEYALTVPYETSSLSQMVYTKSDSNATTLTDGGYDIDVGDNIFTVTVTAEYGTTTETYTITVTRAARVFSYPLVFTPLSGLTYDGRDAIIDGVLPAGSYSYNGNTLTLTNVNFTTTAATALNLSAVTSLNLVLAGNNTFASTTGIGIMSPSFTISGAGSLTVTGLAAAISSTPTLPAFYNYKTSSGGVLTSQATPLTSIGTYIYIETATGVSPTTATFNKADPEDVVITYSLATGTALESITLGQQTLYLNAQYDEDTIGTLEIRRSYLSNLSNGT
ncbi:MAG: cadherin-like beta sandwich domain-containing protein, partial [Ruminococcus sp.]|nr:cadherin-like beta sandwich domain-containing protein [Ruminococcus sp.]